jgi:WXG100 family type VII secretion target
MISVNHKALELAAQDMVAKAKEIKGVLDALDQDIHNDVMQWGGQAKASYVPAKQQWDNSLFAMIQHLQDAATGWATPTPSTTRPTSTTPASSRASPRPETWWEASPRGEHLGPADPAGPSRHDNRAPHDIHEGAPDGFPGLQRLITKIAAAAKTEGIELSQDEIDKAVKKLAAAQDFLNEHGLQEDEQAEGRFGTSPLGQTMSQQHRRVYGIMARSLDNVATDLGQFASGIDAARSR